MKEQQQILNFWRNTELFNLPDFNKECYGLKEDEPLPWELKLQKNSKRYFVWQFTLFFGRLEKKAVVNAIDAVLNVQGATSDWEEPISGYTCLSALILDAQGRPDQRNYVAAAYPFAMDCLKNGSSLSIIPAKLASAQQDFEIRFNISSIAEADPYKSDQEQTAEPDSQDANETTEVETEKTDIPGLNWLQLKEEIAYLNELTDSWNEEPIKVFVMAKEVSKGSKADNTFLNSFFLEDLNELLHTAPNDYNKSLQEYLTIEVNESRRKDLIADKKLLFDTIHPKLMSAGRWPSNISNGLYTAQSGAINTVLSALRDGSGIRGINGPPGTGKTTLLLDVVADCIVQRAKKLLTVKSNQLFTGTNNKIQKESSFTLYCYDINKEIFGGSGIVVASSNNSAVENITKELPAVAKTDQETFKDPDYFASSAQLLINEPSWGILSAALGNFSNRNLFHDSFWKSDKETGFVGFEELLYHIYKVPEEDQTAFYQQKFEESKATLSDLLGTFDKFQKRAGKFHDYLTVYQENLRKKARFEQQEIALTTSYQILTLQEQEQEEAITSTMELINDVRNIIAVIEKRKPSFFFFQKLLNTNTFKKWKADYDHQSHRLEEVLTDKLNHTAAKNELQNELKYNLALQQEVTASLAAVREELNKYEAIRQGLQYDYEIPYEQLFDSDFFNLPIDQIHLRTPYSSEWLNKLRSEIFLSSLDLHRYAILANAKSFKNNLKTFFEMIMGRSVIKREIAETLWNSFFFCVPVVSTALASVSRLFSSMGKDSIGWLLLDEAGQAPPQAAVGIISRSRRCIVVGDPLQVEPVVTIPENLVFKLRQQDELDLVWSPSQTSVQVLADRVSEKGTYVETGNSDEKIWTGFPLRSHRRCDNPMFAIANEIAYANQMVKATQDRETETYLGKSTWFSITAKSAVVNKHVLEDELKLLREKIKELRANGYTKEIFVISPFRSVADACKNDFKTFEGVFCGTIHKFQGKEAEVVFLILGGDPKSAGARLWASKKPNMLNVALTRAKKRFYVIGNKDLWGKCNYFKVMAAQLENHHLH